VELSKIREDVGEPASPLSIPIGTGLATADSSPDEIEAAEVTMNLQLNDDEVQILRGMLHDYLPGLKFEVVRTDAPEMRHALARRQTLCERLLEELSAIPSEGGRRSSA
jgi:hypothetical protein